jgi:hypothetical protein
VQLLGRDLNEGYCDLFKPIYSYTREPAIRVEASVSICRHLVTGLIVLRASLDDLNSAAKISKAYPHVRIFYRPQTGLGRLSSQGASSPMRANVYRG